MRDAKQRLRPLDRIEPPDVWHRASGLEPVGELPELPQATWQRRVAAGTVAFAVFAGAIALVLGAFGSDAPTRRGVAGTPGEDSTPSVSVPLAPIEVTTPARGDTVTSPVTIAGTADVFEATVSIEIRDSVNNVVAETFATATCGSGCRGEFSVEVPYSVGTSQPGEIFVYEVSAADGKRINVVRIPVTLEPGADDPVAAELEGTWTDADGNPVPDGDDPTDDFALTLHTLEGPDHCGWTSSTFLHVAWPLGSTSAAGDFRQYVRDPQGVLSDHLRSSDSVELPADAAPTGFRRGSWELWAGSDADDALYAVNGDPEAGGTWERFARAPQPILCD